MGAKKERDSLQDRSQHFQHSQKNDNIMWVVAVQQHLLSNVGVGVEGEQITARDEGKDKGEIWGLSCC